MNFKAILFRLLHNRWFGAAVRCLGASQRHRPSLWGFKNPLFVPYYMVRRGPDRFIARNDSFIATGSGREALVRFPANLYEPEFPYLAESLVRPGDTVLDIGANAGLHTVMFARLVGASGRVYAFEPVAEMAQQCSLNCAANRHTNVTILDHALGDEPGEFTMNVNISGMGMEGTSSFLQTVHVAARPDQYVARPVQVRRLDDLVQSGTIQGRIAFVKMDTEGFEPKVIRGALRTLQEHRPAMLIEAHSRRLQAAGLSFMWYRELFPDHHALIVHGISAANPFLRLEPLEEEPPEIAVNLLLLPKSRVLSAAPIQTGAAADLMTSSSPTAAAARRQ